MLAPPPSRPPLMPPEGPIGATGPPRDAARARRDTTPPAAGEY
jgi:hypothetical protein